MEVCGHLQSLTISPLGKKPLIHTG